MASKNAKRSAFSAIGETCPKVDSAFSELHQLISSEFEFDSAKDKVLWVLLEECSDAVKVQTCALREALISAYQEKDSIEDELREKIEELEDRLREFV